MHMLNDCLCDGDVAEMHRYAHEHNAMTMFSMCLHFIQCSSQRTYEYGKNRRVNWMNSLKNAKAKAEAKDISYLKSVVHEISFFR